jgi:1,4-alpha-glucan branching enzyme
MGKLAGGGRTQGASGARRGRITHPLRLVLAIAAVLLVTGGFLSWIWQIRPAREEVLVRFELIAPEARSVNLVGDFSDWDPHKFAMKDVTGEGNWQITIRLEKGQVYTYNFLMDGQQWIADPNSLRQVDDGFGGKSSVLDL